MLNLYEKKIWYKNKLLWALVLNFIIVALEIAGTILSFIRHGLGAFIFYTENSNYYTLVASIIFCIFAIKSLKNNQNMPIWIHTLRFISTVCLTITLVVVVLVLVPVVPHLSIQLLFRTSNLFQHLLCPILSLVSFIALENQTSLTKRHMLIALLPTIVYGITCLILNLLKIIEGPYPFFFVYKMPWYISVLSIIGIIFVSYLLTLFVYSVRNHNYKRVKLNKKHSKTTD